MPSAFQAPITRTKKLPVAELSATVSSGGLSASTSRQYDNWQRMVDKLTPLAPDFFERHTNAARAYQLRYLCRRAISDGDADTAATLASRALGASRRPLWEEPIKSSVTFAAALTLALVGADRFANLRSTLQRAPTAN